MKLSDTEARVIAAIENNADLPLSEVAKLARLKEPTVRAVVKRLVERGVIFYYPLIDITPLGYTVYSVFFSLASDKKSSLNSLIGYLEKSEFVAWVAEVGGAYQYCLSIVAKSPREVSGFLDALAQKVGNIFFKKSISAQLSLTMFPSKYLHVVKGQEPVCALGNTTKLVSIDATDRKILAGLMNLSYRSKREFARLLNMPFSTVDVRIRKLIEKKVIISFVYLTNPLAYGMHNFKLLVYAKGINAELRQQIFDFCEDHNNVVVLIECLGNWDFEICVEVTEPSEIVSISQQLFEQFGNELNNVEVIPQFRELKTACFPFLDHAEQG